MSNEHETHLEHWGPWSAEYLARDDAPATPSPSTDTLERREAIKAAVRAYRDEHRTWPLTEDMIADAILALTTSPRVDEGHALRREGIVAFSADIENPRVLKLHFDQDVTSAHRALILDAINARRAALATTPAPREKLEADLVEARTLLARAEPTLNAAFAQADAEFRDQDKIAARHDAIVRQFRSDVRATLNRLSGEG